MSGSTFSSRDERVCPEWMDRNDLMLRQFRIRATSTAEDSWPLNNSWQNDINLDNQMYFFLFSRVN